MENPRIAGRAVMRPWFCWLIVTICGCGGSSNLARIADASQVQNTADAPQATPEYQGVRNAHLLAATQRLCVTRPLASAFPVKAVQIARWGRLRAIGVGPAASAWRESGKESSPAVAPRFG